MTITRGRPKYIGVLRSPPKGQETKKTHTHTRMTPLDPQNLAWVNNPLLLKLWTKKRMSE